jgi:aspartate kinase
MDFPLIRRARKTGDHSAYLNGMGVNGGIENRIPRTRERDLPGGANWVVQKFGGTSVGKFGRVIGEDIVAYVSHIHMLCGFLWWVKWC